MKYDLMITNAKIEINPIGAIYENGEISIYGDGVVVRKKVSEKIAFKIFRSLGFSYPNSSSESEIEFKVGQTVFYLENDEIKPMVIAEFHKGLSGEFFALGPDHLHGPRIRLKASSLHVDAESCARMMVKNFYQKYKQFVK